MPAQLQSMPQLRQRFAATQAPGPLQAQAQAQAPRMGQAAEGLPVQAGQVSPQAVQAPAHMAGYAGHGMMAQPQAFPAGHVPGAHYQALSPQWPNC